LYLFFPDGQELHWLELPPEQVRQE
jgi:hypothetical protein